MIRFNIKRGKPRWVSTWVQSHVEYDWGRGLFDLPLSYWTPHRSQLCAFRFSTPGGLDDHAPA